MVRVALSPNHQHVRQSFMNGDMLEVKTTLSVLVPSALLTVLVGCAAATPAPAATPSPVPAPTTQPSLTPAPVILQYIGNSCTLMTAPDGTRIVSDPYGEYSHPAGIGPLPDDLEADGVTISHTHPDHNNAQGVKGTPQIITASGTFQVGMVKVTGYGGYEGSPSGPSSNPHTIFVFEVGGVKIVHLGVRSQDILHKTGRCADP
jgi:Beta-lactamase superfamily domain